MSEQKTRASAGMIAAGAVVLRSLPWTGTLADQSDVAQKVFDAMERQRETEFQEARHAARQAANTPWNTPQRGLCADDGPEEA